MQEYLILRDFRGSQDGLCDAQAFAAGSVARLSDSLVAALGGVGGGFVRKAEVAAREIAAAPAELAEPVLQVMAEVAAPVVGLEEPVPEGDLAHDIANPAEIRQTKVIEPEESKPERPAAKKGKK